MPLIIRIEKGTERWHVIIMKFVPVSGEFVPYHVETPKFIGNTPMERIDRWAERQLINHQKRDPRGRFSYRLEHH